MAQQLTISQQQHLFGKHVDLATTISTRLAAALSNPLPEDATAVDIKDHLDHYMQDVKMVELQLNQLAEATHKHFTSLR